MVTKRDLNDIRRTELANKYQSGYEKGFYDAMRKKTNDRKIITLTVVYCMDAIASMLSFIAAGLFHEWILVICGIALIITTIMLFIRNVELRYKEVDYGKKSA